MIDLSMPTPSANNGVLEYANPFATYANKIYPKNVEQALMWGEWLLMRHGVYTAAIMRSLNYFLDSVELSGEDVNRQTRQGYEDTLTNEFGILAKLALIGLDYVGLGNSFTSVNLPLKRMLVCPECGLMRAIDKLKKDKDYKFDSFTFRGKCPGCKRDTVLNRYDTRDNKARGGLQVIRWSYLDMVIDNCLLTGESEYYYRIPAEELGKLKRGEELYLKTVPWEFFMAAKANKPLKLDKSTFFHLRPQHCNAVTWRCKGWGLPLYMNAFNYVVQLQMLDRVNEAITMDFVSPLRILTPGLGPGGLDPLKQFSMQSYFGTVAGMLAAHKLDPTTWNFLPAPVDYHVIGGEANKLVPVELIDRTLDCLLTSMQVPQEFYKQTVRINSDSIGLKLFEKSWTPTANQLNLWLNWYLEKNAEFLMWRSVRGQLIPASISEDQMTKQVKLNLAASNVISKGTALRPLGINPDYEQKRMREEADEARRNAQEDEQKAEQESKLSQQIVQPPQQAGIPMNAWDPQQAGGQGGGAPGAGGPSMVAGGAAAMGNMAQVPGGMPSIEQLSSKAQQLAQQLVSADSTTRKSTLIDLKKQNPELHALVSQYIDEIEQGAKTQGLMAARQGGQGQH